MKEELGRGEGNQRGREKIRLAAVIRSDEQSSWKHQSNWTADWLSSAQFSQIEHRRRSVKQTWFTIQLCVLVCVCVSMCQQPRRRTCWCRSSTSWWDWLWPPVSSSSSADSMLRAGRKCRLSLIASKVFTLLSSSPIILIIGAGSLRFLKTATIIPLANHWHTNEYSRQLKRGKGREFLKLSYYKSK